MKVTFDFAAQVWLRGLTIEADSIEDAKDKLSQLAAYGMFKVSEETESAIEVINPGYVKDVELSDIDYTAEYSDFKVAVTNIKYEPDAFQDEADFEAMVKYLPTEMTLDFEDIDEDKLYEEIEDAIWLNTGLYPSTFDYKVISKK